MKHGITIPNYGPFADIHRLTELAREAEDNGWDGFFLWGPPERTPSAHARPLGRTRRHRRSH